MDIHRARFIPYQPSAINALAFSHATEIRKSGGDPKCLRLAVGRANGNIEIWNPARGAWFHEITLYGGKDRSVEGLTWTQEADETDEYGYTTPGRLRLFSIGYSSAVTEWSLLTGLPLRHSSGNHSEVWCLTAQPRYHEHHSNGTSTQSRQLQTQTNEGSSSHASQHLAVGCADGTLAILSTADDVLQFTRYLSRSSTKRGRVLSICYQNWDTVVAGFADSAIRVYNARDGRELKSISLGSGFRNGAKDTLVWAVKALPNGDILSGDSLGEIRIYDGKNYSQIKQIKAHEADVLALGVSVKSDCFFSGSMDRRTAIYSQTNGARPQVKTKSLWGRQSHHRFHRHDIKAMATYEGTHVNVLVSGGLDISPNVVSIKHFGEQNNRALPLLPHRPPLDSAPSARLVMSWWDREIRIWTVPPKQDVLYEENIPRLKMRIYVKGEENITCAALRDDGKVVAVATTASVKLFQLTRDEAQPDKLKVRRLSNVQLPGACVVRFSPDGKWLALITPSSNVQVFRLFAAADDGLATILSTPINLHRTAKRSSKYTQHQVDGLNGVWGSYNRNITIAEFSSDSRVLVTGDVGGAVERWLLEGHEDNTAPDCEPAGKFADGEMSDEDDDSEDDGEGTHTNDLIVRGQHWTRKAVLLPSLDAAPLVLSFRPSSDHRAEPNGNPAVHPTRHNPHPHSHEVVLADNRLVVITAKHRIYEFDIQSCLLTDWARRNPRAPAEFRKIRDLTKGAFWNCRGANESIWIYGASWIFKFDLSKDFEGDNIRTRATEASKRNLEEVLESQKDSTGAGSAVRDNSLGRKIRKIAQEGEHQTIKWIERPIEVRQEDEDDMDASVLPPLQRPRTDGDDKELVVDANESSTWHTLKYRPILGIVPLADQNQANGQADGGFPLEVLLAERPYEQLELPPHFEDVHSKDR